MDEPGGEEMALDWGSILMGRRVNVSRSDIVAVGCGRVWWLFECEGGWKTASSGSIDAVREEGVFELVASLAMPQLNYMSNVKSCDSDICWVNLARKSEV